ncbi:MAG TPA: hypothetical protein V6C65_37075 [Allocoleopsis sp.]
MLNDRAIASVFWEMVNAIAYTPHLLRCSHLPFSIHQRNIA